MHQTEKESWKKHKKMKQKSQKESLYQTQSHKEMLVNLTFCSASLRYDNTFCGKDTTQIRDISELS